MDFIKPLRVIMCLIYRLLMLTNLVFEKCNYAIMLSALKCCDIMVSDPKPTQGLEGSGTTFSGLPIIQLFTSHKGFQMLPQTVGATCTKTIV